MAPDIHVSDNTLKALDLMGVPYTLIETQSRSEVSERKPTLVPFLKAKPTEGYLFVPAEFAQGKDLYLNSARVSANDKGVPQAETLMGRKFPDTGRDSLERGFVGNITQDEAIMLNALRGRMTESVALFRSKLAYLHAGIIGRTAVYDSKKNKMDFKRVEQLYSDLVEVRSPWRAEWFEDDFEQGGDGLYVRRAKILEDERIVAKDIIKLSEDTLMHDRTPGISLDGWRENPTSEGFPRTEVQKGKLYLFVPRAGAGAWFNAVVVRAFLNCDADRSGRNSDLGVFDYFEA